MDIARSTAVGDDEWAKVAPRSARLVVKEGR